ncbi:MAG: hypothetical protein GX963_10870 [Bacteroidales bacterium]|nr:hypothetical protein [Bacteroidales bacterium]
MLKLVRNNIVIIGEILNYLMVFCLATFVFIIFYRRKLDVNLIVMGSSSGKFCDDNVYELLKHLISQGEKTIYIIDKKSTDVSKVQYVGGSVLYRHSFRAILAAFRSAVMIYDTSHIDIIRCPRRYLKYTKTLNISHGVHGLKKKTPEDKLAITHRSFLQVERSMMIWPNT